MSDQPMEATEMKPLNEIPSDDQVRAERAAEESTEVDEDRLAAARARGATVSGRVRVWTPLDDAAEDGINRYFG